MCRKLNSTGKNFMRLEAPVMVILKFSVVWNVTPYGVVELN
jgi:hypothetical protein